MSCGCKGNAPAGAQQAQASSAADFKGKHAVQMAMTLTVHKFPCEECEKDGEKPYNVSISMNAGAMDGAYEKRLHLVDEIAAVLYAHFHGKAE